MLDRPFALFRLADNSGTSSGRDGGGLGIANELGSDVLGEGFGGHAAKTAAYLHGSDGAGSTRLYISVRPMLMRTDASSTVSRSGASVFVGAVMMGCASL